MRCCVARGRRTCAGLGRGFQSGPARSAAPVLDADIAWHEDPSFPDAGVYGIAAFKEYARQFISEFSEIHYEPRELIEAGDDVVADPHDTGIRQARAKTDRLDARALLKLLAAGSLDSLWVPDEKGHASCAGASRGGRSWCARARGPRTRSTFA